MEFKEEIYKGIKIKYDVSERGTFSASALDVLSTNNAGKDRDINNCYPCLSGAELDIKSKIDQFLSNTPKDYEELSSVLTSHLTWTSYESCHLDPVICRAIVGNFIKYKQSNK